MVTFQSIERTFKHNVQSPEENLGILLLERNNCVNIGYGKEAASHIAEVEAALRDCTISYLSLENDELKGELKEIKSELREGNKKVNADLSRILVALHLK